MRTKILVAWASVAALVAWAVGCGSDNAGDSGAAGAAGDDAGLEAEAEVEDELPPPLCTAGARWAPGTRAFKEQNPQWGLDLIAADGVRLSSVDFDGDGWADLSVRKVGVVADDFEGTRTTWLLRNDGNHGFKDVTRESGWRQNRASADPGRGRPGEVVAFGDVDNDGDLDSYTGLGYDAKNPSEETSELMLNNGDGTFSLGPEDSHLRGGALPTADAPAGASFVDFDRDGILDLWVPQTAVGSDPQQNRLYKGDGKGGFVDVTVERGLETKAWLAITDLNEARAHTHSWSGVACDLNNDGNAELLAASYGRAPNHLWQSAGSTGGYNFLNRSIASGYAFDDRQNWSDNESARCWCKLHPSDTGCEGVPAPKYIPCATDSDAFRWDHSSDRELFRLGGNSGATMCADLDNDGWLDLVTCEIMHWDVGVSSDPAELLVNQKQDDVTFTRPGAVETGLKRTHSGGWDEGIMTGAVFDFDNDGWQDIYWGDSDYPKSVGLLYHQESAGKFVKVSYTTGIDHHRSHGTAVADFDHDGDLDIVVGHSTARCGGYTDCYETGQIRFFENVLGQDGNFVQLVLQGAAGTNRAAIGARVTLSAGGVTQTREVGGGYGHFGAQDDLTVHFGLGAECEAEVTVRWPDASLSTQTFKLPVGYRFLIEQGKRPKVLWARPQ
jgi:hypothetical protein